MTNLTIGAAVLLALVVVGVAIWLVPRWQVRGWRRAGITEEVKLAELAVQARSAITQAFGGLALIATLAITAYQVNETRRSSEDTLGLAERGQVSERFSRAVEQLGAQNADKSPAIDIRTGALFSLRRIGLDSEENTEPAFRVVAAYVSNNYEPVKKRPRDSCKVFNRPGPDVATALTSVLPKLAEKLLAEKLLAEKLLEDPQERTILGLRGADLRGLGLDELVLKRFNLRGIQLRFANSRGADFSGSNLSSADFRSACLKGADFRGANLRGADFSGARLDGADFRGARLSRTTDFTSAQVQGAKFSEGVLDLTSLSAAQKRDVIVVPP